VPTGGAERFGYFAAFCTDRTHGGHMYGDMVDTL
jgi:hypothetical protein